MSAFTDDPMISGPLFAGANGEETAFLELLQEALAPTYVLVKKLGAGGMGSIYLARDPALKRLVAVKILSPELALDHDALARFQREAQAVAGISHPNVVAVYGVGETADGSPYLVMQYVDGDSLARRMEERGPLDVGDARRALAEIASALAAAHRNHIIHRDIKPANVLWDEASARALVTDFGIAGLLEAGGEPGGPGGPGALATDATDASDPKLTQAGVSLGTPAYMSPEQILGEPVTDKSDVYSLGIVGYELLTGRGPYDVASAGELLMAHIGAEPRALAALRHDVDPELEQTLQSCLAKDPAQRPSAVEVAARLAHGAGILLEWPPPAMEQLAIRTSTAIRTLATGAFLLATPLVVLTVFDQDAMIRRALPPSQIQMLAVIAGAIVMFAGVVRLWRAYAVAARAATAGYGWLTILEAAFDSRGDTGAVIAGGSEYATLPPAERNELRKQRLIAGVCQLIGAGGPVIGYLIGIGISRWVPGEGAIVFFASLVLPGILLLAGPASSWIEAWRLRATRHRVSRRVPKVSTVAGIAEAWNRSFGAVRTDQALGVGIRGRRRAIRAVVGTALSAWIVVLLGALALVAAGISGESRMALFTANYSSARAVLPRLVRLERYRLPIDSTIGPVAAGQTLYSILSFGRAPRWPFDEPATVIPGTRPPPTFVSLGDIDADMRAAAAHTLSTSRRLVLERLAADPTVEPFRTLARARTFDLYGVSMPLARIDTAYYLDPMAIGSSTLIHESANGNIAAAVLALADDRKSEAELRLRETLSAGFLVIREGVSEMGVGGAIVDKARAALVPFYESAGRLDDARLASPSADPTVIDDRRAPVADARINYERALATLGDSSETRAVRFEVLQREIADAPCGDLRQVIGGPDRVRASTIRSAARQLVRFPSDSALFAAAMNALDHPGGSPGAVLSARPFARLLDRLIGGHRVESCTPVFLGG